MPVALRFLCLLSLAVGALHCTPVPDQEGELSEPQHTACPPGWSSFNNRCFKYFATQLDWADAESYCVNQGANLVSVNSKGEFGFVKNLIHDLDPAERYTWIGLSDIHKEGRWMWSDGSKLVDTFWSPNEPNNEEGRENCVHTNNVKDKLWNDIFCSNKYAFVCATLTLHQNRNLFTMPVALRFLCLLSLAVGALHCTPVPDQEGELSEPQHTACPPGWSSFNNRCFKYFATQLDWADAESYCVNQGANLVSVNSKGEFDFVKNLIHGFDPAESFTWIGLSDLHKEGRWMWSDGSKLVDTFWSPKEPTNGDGMENCVHTNNLKEKLWNDVFCSRNNTWIGLSDLHKEGRWMWSDGSKVVYTFWSPNEPNNLSGSENCVHTNNLKEKLWNDTLCSNKYAFVCATRPGL
ncbi:unnamed protein product [Coregonus sp. 'balchen']|nr:unnamed protein product [Coregonus sp. 'balchen']